MSVFFRRLSRLRQIDIAHPDRPLMSVFLDLPVFCFYFSFLIIVFSLGLHIGNYMVYLFQLMAPFFTMMVVQKFASKKRFTLLSYSAIVLNIFLIMRTLYPGGLHHDLASFQKGWDRARQLINEHDTILNSSALVSELITKDKPLVNTGQNEYFYTPNVPDLFFLPSSNEVIAIGDDFRDGIARSIQNKNYDLVMITQADPFLKNRDYLERNYHHVENISLEMPVSKQVWEVEVWIQK